MSKANTLLKLIAYQKEHPQATDAEIARGIGLSSRQVIRCRKEVNLLKHELADFYLQPGQIQFSAVTAEGTCTRPEGDLRTTSKTDGRGLHGNPSR